MNEKTALIHAKVLLSECFKVQEQLTDFLMNCTEKYGPVLTAEESVYVRDLARRVRILAKKVDNAQDESDERYHQDNSDGEVPLPD